ncbi:MAG TPA: adenylate kinase [Clostridia bacterium]|nr:adenylate kinase [Clostridia bacterium]
MVERLIIMGPPGGGKGTWSKILSDQLCLPHISSGDLFRQELAQETDLGQQIRSIMEAGQLVPDQVTISLIEKVIRQGAGKEGFILDGFPRTLVQAQALEAILESEGVKLDAVVNLAVDESVLIERTLARMVCLDCGQPYNKLTMIPMVEGVCDRCGGKVVQRSDDTEDTLQERLRTYHEATEPLIGFYRDKGLLRVFSNTEPPGDKTKAAMADLLGLAPDSLCQDR